MRPQAIAARVWPGRRPALEPLGGGITNLNFKVTLDGESFVLRIGGTDTELLGIDRAAEHAASRLAEAVGVGPEVVDWLEPEGYLVTRFVEGRPIEAGGVPVEEVAAALRLVHAGGAIPARFDAFRVVETYRRLAAERGARIPAGYDNAQATAATIEAALGRRPLVPCHNDLLAANFIHDGERLRIVDWEYAGMGDPFFDLGNFAANHELDEDAERALLEAYSGAVREADLETLRRMRFMSNFREAMWGVLQSAVSKLEFDFEGYADQHFERLEHPKP